MSYRTPLGRVKGLGSSHSGSKEWLLQKVASAILAVLFLWFAFSFAFLIKSPHLHVLNWISNPVNMTLLLTFISVGIYHAAYGLQTVIEDYVHKTAKRVFYVYLVKTLLAIVWVLLSVSIIDVALSADIVTQSGAGFLIFN